MHLTIGWCTYDGNIVLLDIGTMQEKRGEQGSTVGYTIHLEIKFTPKVY